MGLISKLLGTNNEIKPDITPTHSDALDAQAIPLLLLANFGYNDVRGRHNLFWFRLYTYLVEERLEQHDIPVNRYEWTSRSYPSLGNREYPMSEQFHADVKRGFPNNSRTKPVFETSQSTTFGGKTRTYRRPSGYTDLYIEKYFDYTTVSIETVETHVNAVLDEYENVGNFDIHDILFEDYPTFRNPT